MNRNHTHIGNCQACGREHAIDIVKGDIAKHGYQVNFGQFLGVCPGSDRLPAQKSVDYTHVVIVSCVEASGRLTAYADAIEAGREVPPTVVHYDPGAVRKTSWGSDRKGANVEIPYAQGDIDEQHRARINAVNEARGNARANADHASYLEVNVLPLFGNELETVEQAAVREQAARKAKEERPTKAYFKRQLDTLSVEFDKVRREINDVLLANRPGEFDVAGNKLWDRTYWGPMQLSHWRAKHSVDVLALHPIRLASVVATVEELYAKREQVRKLQKEAGL